MLVFTSLVRLSTCRSKCDDSASHTFSPRTLLPWPSRRGENVPRPNWAGSAAMMPPPTPLFAFGHGLSYTSFEYANFDVRSSTTAAPIAVAVEVRNVGQRAGDEIVLTIL